TIADKVTCDRCTRPRRGAILGRPGRRLFRRLAGHLGIVRRRVVVGGERRRVYDPRPRRRDESHDVRDDLRRRRDAVRPQLLFPALRAVRRRGAAAREALRGTSPVPGLGRRAGNVSLRWAAGSGMAAAAYMRAVYRT